MSDTNSIVDKEKDTLREKYKGKSLLVVEDEYISGQLLIKILSKFITVDLADTAESCYAKILEKDFSVIFMDINLGNGLSGLDVVKHIRGYERYREIPIIATTAYTMAGDKEKFLAAGCSDYLSKPFTQEKLLKLLKEIRI